MPQLRPATRSATRLAGIFACAAQFTGTTIEGNTTITHGGDHRVVITFGRA